MKEETIDVRLYCTVCNKNFMEIKSQAVKQKRVLPYLADTINVLFEGHCVTVEHKKNMKEE